MSMISGLCTELDFMGLGVDQDREVDKMGHAFQTLS